MLDGVRPAQTAASATHPTGEFSSIENGGGGCGGSSGSVTGCRLGVPNIDQPRLPRQVSLRVRRKKLVRHVAARETWQDAADKIRVSSTRILFVLSVYNV